MIKVLLCFVLGFFAISEATVSSPNGSTVWINGETGQISWNSLPGTEVTIVLTRTNTIYHHTIISYTPNDGSFTWQVEIPPQDGWPSSTSSDLVYEIDFYNNGGWNNGGTLVGSSDEFAIEWSGSDDSSVATVTVVTNSPAPVTTITTIANPTPEGLFTTVETETIVGPTTLTTIVTAVFDGTESTSTETLVIQTSALPVVTQTLTNTQQLQTTTQNTLGGTTIGLTTTATTTATTVTPQPQQLYNSGTGNFGSSVMLNVLGIILGATLIFG